MSRILIIEDEGSLQELLALAFFNEGYEPHHAFNGKDGLNKILSLRPDVVLLDLMMPIMSGIEVLKRVNEHAELRAIPIIVITAHADQPEFVEQNIRLYGAREYVRKPFQIGELVRLVARLIAQAPAKKGAPKPVAKGAVRLDLQFRTVWIDDQLIATLSPHKADLLRLLIESEGPVKREKIQSEIWGPGDHVAALEKTVQRLRDDFGPKESRRIQTTPEGYLLVG
jgi:DNA-binding response OmpR family regulator